MSSQFGKCVDASLVTKRLEARMVYANLITQQQLFDDGKVIYIKYQNGGSSSSIVGLGAFGSLITTPAQRDAILASVNRILPVPPVLLTVVPGDAQIALSWLPSVANGGLPVSGYTVVVVAFLTGDTLLSIPVGNISSYIVTGLTNGSSYIFSVYATNAAGDSQASAPVTATPGSETTRPGPPSIVYVSAGEGQVSLLWSTSSGRSILGYTVVYSAVSGPSSPISIPVGNILSYTVTGLTNGVSYTFYVYATNAFGDSDNSVSVTATPSVQVGLQTLYGGGKQKIPVGGYCDGNGLYTQFNGPQSLIFDSSGHLYVADAYNNRIRKIDLSGNVSTVAGNGFAGYADGQGTNAAFDRPRGLTFDSGNLYIADTYNNRIRKIDLLGNVSTFAGNGSFSYADGQGTNASFKYTRGLTFDSGNLYVADTRNNIIRKIDLSGNVSTVAGSSQGSADAQGTNAAFDFPRGITFDSSGNLYIADTYNHRIRKIDMSGNVSTVAGSSEGSADGEGTNASFRYPGGLIFNSGSIYVTDTYNHRIRKIDLLGNVSSIAGSSEGYADGQGTNAAFDYPVGLTFDSFNNNLYVADSYNDQIRKIDLSGNVTTLPGGACNVPNQSGDGVGVGTNVLFNYPNGILKTPNGLFIADSYNRSIKKIDIVSGNVSTVAGNGSYGNADGQGTNARFAYPRSLTFNTTGTLYVTDNNRIRKIDLSGNVSTFAGNGSEGYTDGQGTNAAFNDPQGLTIDSSGSLYVADTDNYVIRKIDPSGYVSTFAGDGSGNYADGQGTNAAFDEPAGLTFDSGNLYVADYNNNRIRKIDMSGNVSTVAGNESQGSGDGQGTNASFDRPRALTFDTTGNLYIADNNIIRMIDPSGYVTTLLGGGPSGINSGCIDGVGTFAMLNFPRALTIDAGILYFCDTYNHSVRSLNLNTLKPSSPTGISVSIGDSEVTLTWSPSSGPNISGYTVVYDQTIVSLGNVLTYRATGLVNGRSYTFGVYASNASGNGPLRTIVATLYYSVYTLYGGGRLKYSIGGYCDGNNIYVQFNDVNSITSDMSGNIYVTDVNRIRKIDLSGNVSTFAGNDSEGSTDGQGTNAAFSSPRSLTFDSGNLYIADYGNNKIRKIDLSGNVSTLVSGGYSLPTDIASDSSGTLYISDNDNTIFKVDLSGNVTPVSTYFSTYYTNTYNIIVTPDFTGNIYATPNQTYTIFKINTSGYVTLLAGDSSGNRGYVDGQGTNAQFNTSIMRMVVESGNLYVADSNNHVIRKIDPSGNVTTFAGGGGLSVPNKGYKDAQGTNALFYEPVCITAYLGNLYVFDNSIIRKIDVLGNVTTFSNQYGGCNVPNEYGDGVGVGTNVLFNYPVGILKTANGFFIADSQGDNNRNSIKKIDSGTLTKITSSIEIAYDTLCGMASDASGILYIADTYTNTIKKIYSSEVITFAGDGSENYIDAQGTNAAFDGPRGLTFDSSGNLYVADSGNNRIRKIDSSGNVSTVAGNGSGNYIDAQGTNAAFSYPQGLTFDSSGSLYVADSNNKRVRKIDSSGNVSTIAGNGLSNKLINGQGTNVSLGSLTDIKFDSGNLYVTDSTNNSILKIDQTGYVANIIGGGGPAGNNRGCVDAIGTFTMLNNPTAMTIDAGTLYICDAYNNVIRYVNIG